MWVMHGAAIFTLILCWSVGIVVALTLADRGPGWTRDHPPYRRRLAGSWTWALAAAGAIAPLLALRLDPVCTCLPGWCNAALVAALPFAAAALVYGRAWRQSWPSVRRRTWGMITALLGLATVALTVYAVCATATPEWRWTVVGGLFVAGITQLGGLTTIVVDILTRRVADEVPTPIDPYGLPARMFAAGTLVTLLILSDVYFGATVTLWPPAATLPVALWSLLGLLLPLGLFAVGHRNWPRHQPLVWSAALAAALIGQFFGHAAVARFPGLVPPPF